MKQSESHWRFAPISLATSAQHRWMVVDSKPSSHCPHCRMKNCFPIYFHYPKLSYPTSPPVSQQNTTPDTVGAVISSFPLLKLLAIDWASLCARFGYKSYARSLQSRTGATPSSLQLQGLGPAASGNRIVAGTVPNGTAFILIIPSPGARLRRLL